MENIISKQLLESIFDEKIRKIEIVSTKNITQIRIWDMTCEHHLYKSWDIYHLLHKAKVWAFKQGYEIVVLAHRIIIYRNNYEVYHTTTKLFDLEMFFNACQWVLDNK